MNKNYKKCENTKTTKNVKKLRKMSKIGENTCFKNYEIGENQGKMSSIGAIFQLDFL